MRTPITQPGFDNIPSFIEIDTTVFKVHTTAAETTLYEVTIPRNALGLTDRVVHLAIEFIALNNSGGAESIVWRAYYGTSAAIACPSDTWADSASPRHGTFSVWLMNTGAVDDQRLIAKVEREVYMANYGALTQDSNEDLDLKVTADFSAADVDLYVERQVCITTQMAP